jgi:hypothetical protein
MIELAPSGRRGGFLIIAVGSAFSSELVECSGVHLRRSAGSTGPGEPRTPRVEKSDPHFLWIGSETTLIPGDVPRNTGALPSTGAFKSFGVST